MNYADWLGVLGFYLLTSSAFTIDLADFDEARLRQAYESGGEFAVLAEQLILEFQGEMGENGSSLTLQESPDGPISIPLSDVSYRV